MAPMCNVIEKFSDFGTPIRSHKYKGKKQKVRCHCVVFANVPPPPALQHRSIVEIDIDNFTPPPLQFKEPTEPIEDPTTTLDLMHVGAGPTKRERRVQTRFARLARKLLSAAAARAAAATQIQSARERKQKATEPLAAPKWARTSKKAPQPAAEEVFKGLCEAKPIRGIRRPSGELEGGAAGPKASSGKSPPQAPPEAPPDGGANRAKDPDCFTPRASEVSTPLPESHANSEASSDATTPRLRPLRAMAT